MKLLAILLLFSTSLFAENLPHLNLEKYKDKTKKSAITVANQYYLSGNKDKALYYLKSAIRKDLNFYDATIYAAFIYQAKGEPSRSLKYIKKAITIDSNKAEAYYYRGVYHLALTDTLKAMDDFSFSILVDPNFHYGYDIFLRLRSFPSWNLTYETKLENELKGKMDEKEYSEPNIAYNLGLLSLKMSKHDQAIACFDKCLKEGNYKAESHFSKGLALYYTKKYPEALDSFSAAAGMDYKTAETKRYLTHIGRLNRIKK